METATKIIGFTDSVNECDCCGKTGLKGTFCVSIDGSEFYYGSTCAYKKHGFDKKDVNDSITSFESKISWTWTLSRKMMKYHNTDNLTLNQIFELLKPLAIDNNKIEIKRLIPSLPWSL